MDNTTSCAKIIIGNNDNNDISFNNTIEIVFLILFLIAFTLVSLFNRVDSHR